MSTRMQQRRGTAAQWLSTNNGNGPILAAGEIGYESDTNQFRIGDGVNHWIDLPSFVDQATLGGSLESYVPVSDLGQPGGVATLDIDGKLTAAQIPNIDEISQDAINSALTAGAGISKEYDDALNTITIANTGVVSLHGTANQINVTSTSGSITASLAHDIEITGTLKLAQDPTFSLEAATKQYVDNVSAGLSFNESVRVATTENITLSGLQTIDGVTVVAGDRVLVKNQTDAKENGIYDASASAWSRSADADNSPAGELKGGDFCLVLEGTVSSGYGYVCSNTTAITIGTTEVIYVPFNAAKAVQAGVGLWETAPGVIAIDNTVATLEDTQTLKNKNISFADNSMTSTIAQLNTAVSDADIATLAGTETLENKTLTAPVINNGTITGTAIDSSSIKLSGVTVATTSDLSTHSADTTNVHGIADMAALATISYVDAAESSANGYTNTELGNHAADTTNIHGIADTSLLVTTTGTQTISNKTLTNPEITIPAAIANLYGPSNFQYISAGDDSMGTGGTYMAIGSGWLPMFGWPETAEAYVGKTITVTGSSISQWNGSYVIDSATIGGGVLKLVGSQFGYKPTGQFGASTNITLQNVTAEKTISSSEISYLDGVTSAIQSQLDTKATTSYVDSAKSSAETIAANALSSHESDTTNVHGIADTSKLVTTDATTQTISGALIITGDLTIQGTSTTVSSSSLNVTDPMIYMGGGNSANLVDLGIVSAFNNGTYQHSGLVRDASDNKWKLFSGVVDEPTSTVDFTNAVYDTLKVGVLEGSAALTGIPTAPTAAALTNTTQIATTAYVQEDNKVAYVTESGTSVTMAQATHMFKTVHCTSSSAVTVSIPTDASDNWPIGTYVNIRQMGTGQITVAAATPATTTVVATDSQFKSRVRYSEIVLEKIADNSWIVVGDTAA